MARYIGKKRKRRLRFLTKCTIILSITLLMRLFTSVFIGSINTNLTMDIQEKTQELTRLKAENQSLNIEIQTLQNKDRVYTIAKDAGLGQNEDNVISITIGANSEAE